MSPPAPGAHKADAINRASAPIVQPSRRRPTPSAGSALPKGTQGITAQIALSRARHNPCARYGARVRQGGVTRASPVSGGIPDKHGSSTLRLHSGNGAPAQRQRTGPGRHFVAALQPTGWPTIIGFAEAQPCPKIVFGNNFLPQSIPDDRCPAMYVAPFAPPSRGRLVLVGGVRCGCIWISGARSCRRLGWHSLSLPAPQLRLPQREAMLDAVLLLFSAGKVSLGSQTRPDAAPVGHTRRVFDRRNKGMLPGGARFARVHGNLAKKRAGFEIFLDPFPNRLLLLQAHRVQSLLRPSKKESHGT